MKQKHQRLTLALLSVSALVGAAIIAAFALKSEASFFRTPSELVAQPPSMSVKIRLGGLVEHGSITRAQDGKTVNFIVTDNKARQAVRFEGITPDLFVEGSGVVADGYLGEGNIFIAETLLAKHDENYVPRELEGVVPHQNKDSEPDYIQASFPVDSKTGL